MRFRFKPDDFSESTLTGGYSKRSMGDDVQSARERQYAEIANRLLDEHIATLPEVGAKIDLQFNAPSVWTPLGHNKGQFMRARLWGVEQIKPCEHVSIEKYDNSEGTRDFIGYAGVCHKCGVKLKPTGWVAE